MTRKHKSKQPPTREHQPVWMAKTHQEEHPVRSNPAKSTIPRTSTFLGEFFGVQPVLFDLRESREIRVGFRGPPEEGSL